MSDIYKVKIIPDLMNIEFVKATSIPTTKLMPISQEIDSFDLVTIDDLTEYYCTSKVIMSQILNEMGIVARGTRKIIGSEGNIVNKYMYDFSIVFDITSYLNEKYQVIDIKRKAAELLLELENE